MKGPKKMTFTLLIGKKDDLFYVQRKRMIHKKNSCGPHFSTLPNLNTCKIILRSTFGILGCMQTLLAEEQGQIL